MSLIKALVVSMAISAVWYGMEWMQYQELQWDRKCDNVVWALFRAILKTIRKRAGLTCRVYPHKSRKTLGMNLKNRGVDIGTIQEIMGHADPGVTARYYAQSNPRTLRSVRERVNV